MKEKYENLKKFEKLPPKYDKVSREKVVLVPRFEKTDGVYNSTMSSSSKTVKIMCVGDLMGEPKMQQATYFEDMYNFRGSFKYVREIFKDTDFVIGNLETNICTTAPYAREQHKIAGKYHCNSPVEYLDALRYAGFDIFALSNNHNLDCGTDGIQETLSHLEEYGFGSTGLFLSEKDKRYILINVNGIKIGFLSYSTWFNKNEDNLTEEGKKILINMYSSKRVKQDITDAKSNGVEFILVYMHWGVESEYSNKVADVQKRIAQVVADAGADYIVGSHPHALQEYNIIQTIDGRKVPVAYSLGNFYTSDINIITRKSIILSFTVEKENDKIKITNEFFIPCYCANYYLGNSYPIIPAINELNGGLSENFLSEWYASALKIIRNKIRPVIDKRITSFIWPVTPSYKVLIQDYYYNNEGKEKIVGLTHNNQKIRPMTYSTLFKSCHLGFDIIAAPGTKVLSITAGQVINATCAGNNIGIEEDCFRNFIILKHDDFYMDQSVYSVYAHLSIINFKIGDKVKQGDVLGLSENEGSSYIPHCHFEIRIGENKFDNCIDPIELLPSQNLSLINKIINEDDGFSETSVYLYKSQLQNKNF